MKQPSEMTNEELIAEGKHRYEGADREDLSGITVKRLSSAFLAAALASRLEAALRAELDIDWTKADVGTAKNGARVRAIADAVEDEA